MPAMTIIFICHISQCELSFVKMMITTVLLFFMSWTSLVSYVLVSIFVPFCSAVMIFLEWLNLHYQKLPPKVSFLFKVHQSLILKIILEAR